MRLDNVVLVLVCGSALAGATVIAWRGRQLAVMPVGPASAPATASAGGAALEALRTVVCVLSAGAVAGVLVAGLGGRLVMRLLAATSGSTAQGALTEAGESVGEITFGGTVGFVIFVGLLLPVAAGLMFVPIRHVLPRSAWASGALFGLFLVATLGVGDPLSPDNVDFVILRPLALAVLAVVALGVLFGATFAALAARFDARVPALGRAGSLGSGRGKAAYGSLIFLTLPPLLVATIAYVVGCAVARGRVGARLDRPGIRTAALAIGVVASLAAAWRVTATATQIL